MRQAPSFAAKISSARLGLAAIRKTALIAGIFVEDQRCLERRCRARAISWASAVLRGSANCTLIVLMPFSRLCWIRAKPRSIAWRSPSFTNRPRTISRGSTLVPFNNSAAARSSASMPLASRDHRVGRQVLPAASALSGAAEGGGYSLHHRWYTSWACHFGLESPRNRLILAFVFFSPVGRKAEQDQSRRAEL